jgi:hypothetical protein
VTHKFKFHGVTHTHKAMRAVGQTMSIYLEAMTQSGLHHARSSFNLIQQSLNIHMEIFVNLAHVFGNNGPQQKPTESGSWVNR